MEEVRFIDVNRVSIPLSEYRELIEAKCKAEAEADSRQSDWYRENTRANQAERSLDELKTEFEELKAKYEEELKQNGRD
jgi:hypothetical protein|nr:MAG TPA: hypothetical protein [Caudoviricetes sp.]